MLRKNKQNKLILFFILIFMAITYETTFGALNKRDKEIAQLIMPREGFSSTVYSDVDRQGIETGFAAGFGHRLTDEELKQYKVGEEIPHKQAVDWLRADIARTRKASQEQASQIPNVTEEFQESLQKVNFQLGPGWAQKFPTAWEHLKAGRWDQAIEEIKFTEEGSGQESKWSQQTPERVEDFTQAIEEQWEAAKVPSTPEYTEPMADHWQIEEELEKIPKSAELFDPTKKEENQLKIKDVVNQLGDSKWTSFYQNLTKPESVEIFPEYLTDTEAFDFIGKAETEQLFRQEREEIQQILGQDVTIDENVDFTGVNPRILEIGSYLLQDTSLDDVIGRSTILDRTIKNWTGGQLSGIERKGQKRVVSAKRSEGDKAYTPGSGHNVGNALDLFASWDRKKGTKTDFLVNKIKPSLENADWEMIPTKDGPPVQFFIVRSNIVLLPITSSKEVSCNK